jgi:hypothetical protein
MELEPTGKLTAKHFLLRAGLLGGKYGFLASGLYSLLIVIVFTGVITYSVIHEWLYPSDSTVPLGVLGVLALSFSAVLVASVVGVLPGTILGVITAIITAIPLFLLRHRLTIRGATVVGVATALLIAFTVHPFFAPSLLQPVEPPPFTSSSLSWDSYLLFLGVPSIFYIVANGYGSRQLFRSL